MPTMLAELVNTTLVMVDSVGGIAPEDWQKVLARTAQHDYQRVVVLSQGPALTSQQRNQLRAAVGEHKAPAAIITGSKLVETVVSILNLFFHNQTKAFPPTHVEAALDFVKLSGVDRSEVQAAMARMQAEVAQP